ncbi:HlyD family secretion protein [Dictyobacter kobayashii]|uniref:Multidrug resistance protein A n=1 Tax=Dictyobacter kobayashii TaxID=2014872 RepID=A0A402APQ5_9CHLR|nr:efflux RND transporter periplasmic adaptor subunit [Dictyobacter kobayashii]GCE21009.1 multidrug resistance protein A [Dictyobacter kobayashii]
MRRIILIPTLTVIVFLAIIGGVSYYVYQSYLYYQTDDARITGNIVPIQTLSSGQLSSFTIKQGDTVTAGQVIALITPVPTGTSSKAPPTQTITSPISGTIISTTAVQGQNVTPGLTLAQIANLNTLSVTADIDENAIDNIKAGQDVDIHVDAYGDSTFTGKVQQKVMATSNSFALLPTQDTASSNFTKVGQRIPVIISLDGAGGKEIVPGMSVEVSIHIH